MKAYKAFDKDLKCRGFQYEVGQTYEHDGPVKECESGFHACENPFDVLNYYDVIDSRFALVELGGETSKGKNKIAAAKISIAAELKLPEFISSCVGWIIENCKPEASGDSSQLAASGDSSQLAASGDSSQLAASGDYSQLAASGDNSVIASSADQCRAKGGNGTWISLAEFKEDKCIGFATGCVGQNGLKPDTYYKAENGKLVEVKS